MSRRLVDDSTLAEGISPRAANEVLDRLERQLSTVRMALGELCTAYDAELNRVYGYAAYPDPRNAKEELRRARQHWIEALRSLELPSASDLEGRAL